MASLVAIVLFALCLSCCGNAYKLVHNYDYTNWYTSFIFENLPDPTHGFVEYVALDVALSLGLTKIIGNQVYMGVDNTSVISTYGVGRKSIWLESHDEFFHGLLIGDFAHVPGSNCGSWPAFWTIRNGHGTYGEIDIYEGFNNIETNYMTLHTGGKCMFDSPTRLQLGVSNNNNFNCNLDSAVGCSVKGPTGSYGSSLNENGGGVYAMEWTSRYIKIFFFPRHAIPSDIQKGNPNPNSWGKPTALFDTRYGDCNLDESFPPQTIYFDTTFCGAAAGGKAWTDWTDCSSSTGHPTCQEYVASTPHAYDSSYWLVNSVKVYQR